MHIAMILSTPLPPCEGIGFYAWNLSCQLTRMGHNVHMITRGGLHSQLPQKFEGITIWRPIFLPVYPLHVHIHGLFVSLLIRLLEPEIDVIHLHSPLVPYLTSTRPVLLTFHSSVTSDIHLASSHDFYTILMKLQAPVSYWLEVQNIKHADQTNAVSPWVANIIHRYPYISSDIDIMWNGVDTNLFSPLDLNIKKEKFVLSVGRITRDKGLKELIEAAKMVLRINSEVKFFIVGDGNLRLSLEKLLRTSGLASHIQMVGHVSDRNKLVRLYQNASLFVLPSFHESVPTVLLEAMACACPVVASNVGGIPDVIVDGENGLLVFPHDPQALASRILEVLGNPSLASRLGASARQTVLARFSWEMITTNYVSLYHSLVESSKS
jgi:glycosyltransferase involved in cell wall biosynthesis